MTLPVDGDGPRSISPTDISQFVRLEQCERYLRLRLHERAHGERFLRDYGVRPQSIPPLLTRSGASFEDHVESEIVPAFRTRFFARERRRTKRANDNRQVVALARMLAPGDAWVLFQPRLQADLGRWRLRGDIDLLRIERDAEGRLRLLVADIKSSTAAKVEHRLQVAFYLEMLTALLDGAGLSFAPIEMAILYRGAGDRQPESQREREAAQRLLGVNDALLEIVDDPESYRGAVRDLVSGPNSTAERVAEAGFADLFYHLSYKCDGCLYNEFCMKWSAEHDDLSLLPQLTPQEKTALRQAGITTVQALATLKVFANDDPKASGGELIPADGKEQLVRRLAAAWPVGPRLDELVHRARRYRRFKGDSIQALTYIPNKGYGSLPYADADHNPNLVRVYIDAQHDYLQDRIYMLGALVAGSENGVQPPHRRRSIVHLADGAPDTAERERELFVHFVRDVVRAVVEVAAPDRDGQPRAPVHLIFYDRFNQQLLLAGLARHLASVLQAAPLYDFVTQLAAYDSPVVTFLAEEIRELKIYPMVCQSLQAVASYLKFDWNQPRPYRKIFGVRMFDYWSKLDGTPGQRNESLWYTGRSRFNSQIPLEYAYAAWDELERPAAGAEDDFASYRAATPGLLRGFQARRLEALEWVAADFHGNQQTEKGTFALPNLATFKGKAQTLAEALDEFLTIERHADLGAWRAARLAPPERRVLSGDTLIVEYHEMDQDQAVVERNRENVRRWELAERYERESADGRLSAEQRKETQWSQDGLRVRLRVVSDGLDCGIDETLALSSLNEGDWAVVMPRRMVDTRPGADPTSYTPTPKQLLYAGRALIERITGDSDGAGSARSAFVEVRMQPPRSAPNARGFLFQPWPKPFRDGERYTLDDDPNDWYGYYCLRVVDGLRAGQQNTLYRRLAG